MAEPGFPPRSLNCKATELNQNAPWHGAQSGWDQDPVACFPHQEPESSGSNLVEPATGATVCSLKEQSYAEWVTSRRHVGLGKQLCPRNGTKQPISFRKTATKTPCIHIRCPSRRGRHHVVYNFSELNQLLEAHGGIRQTGWASQVARLPRFFAFLWRLIQQHGYLQRNASGISVVALVLLLSLWGGGGGEGDVKKAGMSK